MSFKLYGGIYTQLRPLERTELTTPVVKKSFSIGRSYNTIPPPVLDNMAMWFDASDISTITKSGTTISAIADKTGNNRGWTGTADWVEGGQNGLDVVGVAQAQSINNANMNFSATTCTIFSVTRMVNATVNGRIIQGVSNNWLHGFWQGQHCAFYYGAFIASETNQDFLWYVHSSYITSAGAGEGWENGVSKGSAASGLSGPNNMAINTGNQPTEDTVNQVAEILVYSSQLQAADMRATELYLRAKWGF